MTSPNAPTFAAPTVADLSNLLGCTVSDDQGGAALSLVTQLAAAYTRDRGFTSGAPNSDIAAVIVSAAARLVKNPSQLARSATYGPSSVAFTTAWTGWTVVEQIVLDRYRIRAV